MTIPIAGVFLVACLAILIVGTKIAIVSEQLAEKSGLGQALFGAVFLAASTSLPGLVTTATAGYLGNASLAVGNGIGSIAVQTVFLAFADLFYKKANLEHAAASVSNIIYVIVLILLLSIVLFASLSGNMVVGYISPFSFSMIIIYIWGLKLSQRVEKEPMWNPVYTELTVSDNGAHTNVQTSYSRLILKFLMCAFVLTIAGIALSKSANDLASKTGINSSLIGATLTGVITSLPELVTTLTATRRGALVLAVSNIIGGNTFDSLFLAVGDIFYDKGSIFFMMTQQDRLLVVTSILLTSLLGLGLVVRERHGWKGIGFESVAVIVLYFSCIALII